MLNDILKGKNSEEVFLGNTYNDVKNKSIALGLDLKGGMSVTLELSTPALVKNYAADVNSNSFSSAFDAAVEEYNTVGGDFVDIFARKHKELSPEVNLIEDFSTQETLEELSIQSTDEEVVAFLKSLYKDALSGVETIMENRINQFGVAQPNITRDEETNRIYIELPGVKDQTTVRNRLQSTANLEFYRAIKGNEIGGIINALLVDEEEADVLDDLLNESADSTAVAENAETATETDTTSLESLLGDETAEADEPAKTPELLKIFQPMISQDQGFMPTPIIGYAKAKDTARVNELINEKAAEMLTGQVIFAWANYETKFDNNDTLYYELFALQVPEDGKARVGGSDIDKANVGVDENSATISVNVTMNPEGADKWAEMTDELRPRTGANGGMIYEYIAITMDNKVFSAPRINGPIPGGNTQITGNFTAEEAKGLVNLLNGGALPAPCVIVDEAVVGPTIGEANSRGGLISFGIALAIVLAYMIFYYGKAGVIADIALVANILFIVGCLAAFGAVLTLAGIAGIVLTIGMSVDANVLIYERIREEIADGKGMKLAVKDGYKKALAAILDANITTLLTAFVLKSFGTGPIESFASTLIIGIFTSVFAAVVITRLIFEWRLEKSATFDFSTKASKGLFKNLNFQFIKNRKKFYIVSGLLVVLGLVAIFTRGLKPSVEFAGGRTYEMVFTQPVADKIDEIESELRANLIEKDGKAASVEVKSRNSDFRVEIATNYLSTVPGSGEQVHEAIENTLEAHVADYGTSKIENSRSVSVSISEELKSSSLLAIVLSLIIIFAYILVRFGKWQYGAGAIFAMIHDVTIVLGIFAALHGKLGFNMEIDQAFIAAILTVVGYSINDTVVVFDRIREYLNKYRGKDRKEVINLALNTTLSRTINTSLSTFIVLLTIFIFDEGGAIRGFVFALMIGVVVGTYSSICIATPAVVDLGAKADEEKEKKKVEEEAMA